MTVSATTPATMGAFIRETPVAIDGVTSFLLLAMVVVHIVVLQVAGLSKFYPLKHSVVCSSQSAVGSCTK